jgi:hypothetical protein
MILRSTTKISFLLFFSLFLHSAKAQVSVAQQTALTGGWYSGLSNYEDPMDPGFVDYSEFGQTFRSGLTTSITTVEFFIQALNHAGNVNVEIYSCSGPYAWGSLLGTKANVAINSTGWVTADLSTLNIQVINGNYYGYRLIPQTGLQAGAGVKNADVYTDGDCWWSNGMGSEGFDFGLDAGFRIEGAGVLAVDLTSFNALKQGNNAWLNWTTAAVAQSNNFFVEHRTNGNWSVIGSTPVNPTSNSSYDFTHNNPVNGSNYYRIAALGHDGKYSYSEVRELYFGNDSKSFDIVSSNPARGGSMRIVVYKAAAFSFYNTEGKLVWKKDLAAGMHNVDLGSYPKGLYFLRSEDRTERILSQ